MAPSSFIELMSVSWPGSREVGSATRPTTSTPAVAAIRAGAALPIGTRRVGATTDRATLAQPVLRKPRRVRRCTLGVRELEFVTRNSFPRRHYVWRRPRYLARSGSAQE